MAQIDTLQLRCLTCPKVFKRKGDLNRHKLIHTGVKPHVCESCGKAFSQLYGLKTHRNIHTKAKPFKCGIHHCEASFGDPSSCSRHRQEAHFHVGNYRCPSSSCHSSIKRRSAFVAHLKKHGIDPKSIAIESLFSFSRQDYPSAREYATSTGPELTYPSDPDITPFPDLPAWTWSDYSFSTFEYPHPPGNCPVGFYGIGPRTPSLSSPSSCLSLSPSPQPSIFATTELNHVPNVHIRDLSSRLPPWPVYPWDEDAMDLFLEKLKELKERPRETSVDRGLVQYPSQRLDICFNV